MASSLFSCYLELGLVFSPRLGDRFVSQYPKEFYACVSGSRTVSGLCIYYYYFTLCEITHRHKLMVVQWSLSDSKSLRVSITLLNIQADLNYTVL